MLTRRRTLASMALGAVTAVAGLPRAEPPAKKALIAITLDLEMSAEYPRRGMTEWNYRKGELDADTKQYAVEAAKRVKQRDGVVHFFAVGQTLEQPDVDWLKGLAEAGHPIGNHTYDHINLKATKAEDLQHRFRRAPWLLEDRPVGEVIENNIAMTTRALKQRCGIEAAGFRTPGGFHDGLSDRPELQRLLLKQGFTWVSSLYPQHKASAAGEMPGAELYADLLRAQAAAQPFAYPSGLIEIPMSPISDVTAFRTSRWKLEWFLKAIRAGVEEAIRNGTMFDFLAHPSCLVVEDPKFQTIDLICDLVQAAGDRAAIVDLGTIAKSVGK